MTTFFDMSKVSAASVRLPSEAYVNYLFDAKGPKYLFDDIFHFSMRYYARHESNRNMLPVVKLMLSTIINHALEQNLPLMMVPEAITNGKLYYDLALEHKARIQGIRDGHLVTYRMGEVLSKAELEILQHKNKNRATTRLEGFQRIHPDAFMISPTGMEAMLATMMKERGFRNVQALRDEDFEAFWMGICFACQRGGFSDDVAYSRNGNFETFALFQMRYGIIPFRPKGDVEISFPGKKSITPFDYTQMLFAHLLDVVPKGFTSDLSVKMAVRMMMLEDMRTKKMAHPVWGELNRETMNPELRDLPSSHDRNFTKLSREILRFMVEHNLGSHLGALFGLDGYDGLENFYFEKVSEIGPILRGASFSDGRTHLEKAAENLDMDSALKKNDLFHSQLLQIPYQLDGEFFCQKSSIFDLRHFERCGLVEQIVLRTFMGLIETPKPCLKEKIENQGGVFLLIDRRGGKIAADYAHKYGCAIPSEARGVKDSFDSASFDGIVKEQNIQKSNSVFEELKERHPKTVINSLEMIEADFDSFCANRKAFVADGPPKLSGLAKIAYGEEIMLRSTRLTIFDQSWENSDVLTNLRIHARKVQLGLINRPKNMPRHSMVVADLDDGCGNFTIKSLKDDLYTLTAYMEELIKAKRDDYPKHVVHSLLQTVIFINLYYTEHLNVTANPNKNGGLIDWQSVPIGVKDGLETDKDEVIKTRDRAKQMILQHGLGALSIEDVHGQVALIDPDYEKYKQKFDRNQRNAKERRTRGGSHQKHNGLNAA